MITYPCHLPVEYSTSLLSFRKTPMSTVAIMNSARKAIEKARRLSTVQAAQSPQSGPRRVVSWENENTPPPQNLQVRVVVVVVVVVVVYSERQSPR